jgi:hypothetical protein
LGAVLLPSKLLVASAGAELAERSATTESAITTTNPNFAAVFSSSLPIIAFVCSSWHLGSRTSDEGFHNINSTLIIFSLGHEPALAGPCGRSSRSYQAGGFLFPKKSSASRLSGEKV